MARALSVGNGRLQVNFDDRYRLRDVLLDGRMQTSDGEDKPALSSYLGVYTADRGFSTVDEQGWERELRQEDRLPVTDCVLTNHQLGVRLHVQDAVHPTHNIHIRRVVVEDLLKETSEPRDIRIVATHQYSLDGIKSEHTALVEGTRDAVLTQKNNHWIMSGGGKLVATTDIEGHERLVMFPGPDEATTSQLGMPWSHAATQDMRDGALSANLSRVDGTGNGGLVGHNTVDSATQFNLEVPPGGSATVYLWDVYGADYREAKVANAILGNVQDNAEAVFTAARRHWAATLAHVDAKAETLDPKLRDDYRAAASMIYLNTVPGGAILAGTDGDSPMHHISHDAYNYVWPRDGALVADAMSADGDHAFATEFFDFCARAMSDSNGGRTFMEHKYNPDGTQASTWLPAIHRGREELRIQEDETALLAWSTGRHVKRVRDPQLAERLYKEVIRPSAEFMVNYTNRETDLPWQSWDLWEEKYGVHAFTVASVYGGLTESAQVALALGKGADARKYEIAAEQLKAAFLEHFWSPGDNRFASSLGRADNGGLERDMTIDASMHGIHRFGLLAADDPRVVSTMEAIGKELTTPFGGIARYKGDQYYRDAGTGEDVPGNPWPVCTSWQAQWEIARAKTPEDLKRAEPYLRWIEERAAKGTGILAEQYNPLTGEARSTMPLTWSHAELVAGYRGFAMAEAQLSQRAASGVAAASKASPTVLAPHSVG